MKEKPLLIRFLLLAILAAGAVLVVMYKPRQMGMDLAGGHSLVFKVETGNNRQILDQVLDTLKERVDPEGVRNLEWRGVGNDRIEVRMPAGSEESRHAKAEYFETMEALDAWNITQEFVLAVAAESDAAARKALLTKRGIGPAEARGKLLLECVNGYLVAERAAAAVDQAKLTALYAELDTLKKAHILDSEKVDAKWAEIDALTGPADEVQTAYEDRLRRLQDGNVKTQELAGILKLYAPEKIRKEMKTEDVEERDDLLNDRLKAFRGRYEAVEELIVEVTAKYKSWADGRGRLDDPEDLIRLIRQAGVLEFRISPQPGGDSPVSLSAEQIAEYAKQLAEPEFGRRRQEPYQWFLIHDPKETFGGMIVQEWSGRNYMLLANEPDNALLQVKGGDEWQLDSAYPTTDQAMNPAVGFKFNEQGSKIFNTLTSRHKGRHMAILLDDEVYSAPVIKTAITGTGVIEGSFTRTEVSELVRTLNAGSLRARVNPNPVSRHSIGPTLGAANIARGYRAAKIGLISVLIFMMLYYLAAGLIANFALALNILLVLAAMTAFEVTFTLPAIAGIILTIGIAVDANVLIFERLREEQGKAQSFAVAIRNAYDRALSAIVDGNITTMLTCVILAWVGSAEVRGFGITLGIGIAVSLFTALVVTRWVFRLLDHLGMMKGKVLMLRLFGVPNINWIGKRRVFWGVSVALIVVGLASLIGQGWGVLGIEFRQGSRAVIRFHDDATIGEEALTDSRVETALSDAGWALGHEKMTGQNVQVNELKTDDRVGEFVKSYDAQANGGNGNETVELAEWVREGRQEGGFTRMDADADGVLTEAELEANLPEPRYQISTPESDPEVVREVIDKAFSGGALRVQKRLASFELTTGKWVPQLQLAIGADGYHRLTKEDFTAGSRGEKVGGKVRKKLEANPNAVLMVFEVSGAEALSEAEVVERITSTRRQAGREEAYVVTPLVLALTSREGREDEDDKAMVYAVVVPTDGVLPEDYDTKQWNQFAAGEVEILTDAMTSRRSLEGFTSFDAAMTARASQRAIVAIMLSWLVIIAYLWFRFGSAQWGLAAVICLIHDIIVVIGLVAMCNWIADTTLGAWLMIRPFKIDLPMIAAVLTVIGYSVNDTIVVFDRIRENRGKLANVSPQIINRSVNQTLSRTVLTSTTTLIVVVVMYVWGGDGIHGFSFALLAGVLFGTYSSVAIASPLLLGFKQAMVAKVTRRDTETEPTAK